MIRMIRLSTLINEYGRTAQSHDVIKLLGLPAKAKLPVEGMPPRDIQGVTVWVNSVETARSNGQFHRVRSLCQGCGRDVPTGRMNQHSCNPDV